MLSNSHFKLLSNTKKLQNIFHFAHFYDDLTLRCKPVFKRIFILDRIEYRILFALAKLTESNNEYYSCCEIYSNNIRIVQDIRIFEYFRIIFNAKMKDLLKYQKTLCFVKMPSVLTIIRPKLNYHSFCFLLNKYLFK